MVPTKYPPELQQTATHVPLAASPAAPAPSSLSLPGVALIEGSSAQLADEIAALLRRRLQTGSMILLLGMVLLIVRSPILYDAGETLFRVINLAVVIGILVALRSRLRLSVPRLRQMELVMFGLLLLQMMAITPIEVGRALEAGDVGEAAAMTVLLLTGTSLLMVVYGLFVPNTWQRAAVVLVPMAVLPVALVAWMCWAHRPLVEYEGWLYLAMALPAPVVSLVAAVYGTDTIQRLRRNEFQARRFGQYHLLRRLGGGGMGEVYEAEHVLLKRPCALKLIRHDMDDDPQAIARFEREVQAMARLSHWNTVEVFDYGLADDGTFYYVMELLPGLSLQELVERYGPLPPGRAVHFLRQVCRALHEAHSLGMIHRDIKPSNIFAAYRGGMHDVAKLLDFGLVKHPAQGEAAPESPAERGISGSPLYMSPEQGEAYEGVDRRSDIYSLGAAAFYLLTGRAPFPGCTPWEVMLAHARENPTPPSAYAPSIPLDLDAIVVRCLQKRPEQRFPDVLALEEALAACSCAADWDWKKAEAWWTAMADGSLAMARGPVP